MPSREPSELKTLLPSHGHVSPRGKPAFPVPVRSVVEIPSFDDLLDDDLEEHVTHQERYAEELWEVEILEAEIIEGRRAATDTKRRLDLARVDKDFHCNQVDNLERELEERNALIVARMHALTELFDDERHDRQHFREEHAAMMFVESTAATLISTAVVLVNLATMIVEINDSRQDFFWLDQFCMIFYLCELIAKALLWRNRLLVGPLKTVWSNWLDVIVVATGVLDQWLTPLLFVFFPYHMEEVSHNMSVLLVLRALRLARLVRILKIVHVFYRSDLSWANGDRFQVFIMAVIGANSIIMAFETDHPNFFLWVYVEQILLAIFAFELFVRLKLAGCTFFTRKEDIVWNLLDFTIVVGGVVDQWLLPTIAFVQSLAGLPPAEPGRMGQVIVMLRMARLLRILRLVRLVRSIPPLFTLIVGVVQAMQGMMWVLVLTAGLLYVFALFAVKLVGHGLIFGDAANAPSDVTSIFPDVIQSMFVLFKVMNGQCAALVPLFRVFPISKLCFVVYMVMSNWAILSILTAVVSQNMIDVTEDDKASKKAEQEVFRWHRVRCLLTTIFKHADTDADGQICRSELSALFTDQRDVEALRSVTGGLEVTEACELYEALRCIYQEKSVPLDRLVEALHSFEAPVRRKELTMMEARLSEMERSIGRILALLVVDVKPTDSPSDDPSEAEKGCSSKDTSARSGGI